MGVFGLNSYIKNHFSTRISIIQAAKKYRLKTGRRPVLLIDRSNFLLTFYRKMENYPVLVNESKVPLTALIKFIQRLEQSGIEVIFVGESGYDDDRLQTIIERNQKRLKLIKHIFLEYIDKGIPYPKVLPMQGSVFMFLAKKYIRKSAGKYKEPSKEADGSILSFIHQFGCFGVLSDDSDLKLLEEIPTVFSTNDLSIKDITTTFTTIDIVSECLNLPYTLFPMFATLCGNDKVKADELRQFHLQLLGDNLNYNNQRFDVFEGVSRFLMNYSQRYYNFDSFPEDIAELIEMEHLAETFRKSVDSYCFNKSSVTSVDRANLTSSESWNAILNAVENNAITIMTEYRKFFINSFQIYDNPSYPPSIMLTRDIYKRYYGYLFDEHPESLGNVEVLEYLNWGDSIPETNKVTPQYPDMKISILTLMKENCSEDLKWKMLCWIIDPDLDPSEVMLLPRPLCVPALAVYIMCCVKRYYCEDWVEEILVTQAALLLTASESDVYKARCGKITGPSIHIATVYADLCFDLYCIASNCGGPVRPENHLEVPFFDAKIYNDCRYKIQKGATGSSLCQHSKVVSNGYNKVMNFLNKNKKTKQVETTSKSSATDHFVPIADLEERFHNLKF